MRNFTIYNNNAVDHAVFSGGSWQANLPLANLYSPITTKRARSVDAQASSTQFFVSLAEPVDLYGIQGIATNLSSAGLYRFSWYTDATFLSQEGTTGFVAVGTSIDWGNTAEWFDWLDVDFWLGAEAFSDPDNQGRDIRHTFGSATTIQYLKIEFDDATNANGFVELGYLFIGEAFIPSQNIAPDPKFSRVTLTSVQEAVGGGQYFNRRGSRKRLVVTWPLLPREEVLGDIDDIIRIHDIDRPVFVDLDPEDNTTGRKTAFLARIVQLPEASLLQASINNDTGASIGFEFIQVL